jgi:pimeloyl-ACP methyl ester carboxylesterase
VSAWSHTPIEMQFRTIDGLTIRFAESEDCDDHALLLSPWPESLLAFEPTWARLAEHTHLVAIDLPGFGHSQRRDALLSPRAMGEFLIRITDTFGLENPHVIGPDVGTAAALFAAALSPGRLRSLVVGSGATAFPLQLGGVLKDWVEAPDLEPYRTADPRQIVTGALADIEGYPLPDYVDPDAGADHRRQARPGSATGQRRVPPPAAAPQQARPHRRRALHLGRRSRPVRRTGHELVERRSRDHQIRGSTLIERTVHMRIMVLSRARCLRTARRGSAAVRAPPRPCTAPAGQASRGSLPSAGDRAGPAGRNAGGRSGMSTHAAVDALVQEFKRRAQ